MSWGMGRREEGEGRGRSGGDPAPVRRVGDRGGWAATAGGPQPLTAPCMMPPTICLPKIANTSSSGSVPSSAPAMISDWSGV